MKSSSRVRPKTLLILFIALLGLVITAAFNSPTPIVRVVLFYSDYCPHCEYVMTTALPPLLEEYPENLFIMYFNVNTEEGNALLWATIEELGYPDDEVGVPFMIVGEYILIGSGQIPEQLPGIIEEGLAAGGIDWPELPTLRSVLETYGVLDITVVPTPLPTNTPTPTLLPTNIPTVTLQDVLIDTPTQPPTQAPTLPSMGTSNLEEATAHLQDLTVAERFALDKAGNTLSVIVLVGMVLSVGYIGFLFYRKEQPKPWPEWVAPILILIGFGVALYLSFVEVTATEAVCGPVGDCNTVQQSSYAHLFGILPIGILGALGYVGIAAAWLVFRYGPMTWRRASQLILFAFTAFGTLFSIYLTFLEPFVIGATCAWCLTSSVVMTLLLFEATPATLAILNALEGEEEKGD